MRSGLISDKVEGNIEILRRTVDLTMFPMTLLAVVPALLLVRQISRQCQISIEFADGNNVSIRLDQKACERLLTRHRAAPTKRVGGAEGGVSLAVGIETCQAAENWRIEVDQAADYDLPIRLQSYCPPHRCSLGRVKRFKGTGVEGCVHFPGFEETAHADLCSAALRIIGAARHGHNVVAVCLENGRKKAALRGRRRHRQTSRRHLR